MQEAINRNESESHISIKNNGNPVVKKWNWKLFIGTIIRNERMIPIWEILETLHLIDTVKTDKIKQTEMIPRFEIFNQFY